MLGQLEHVWRDFHVRNVVEIILGVADLIRISQRRAHQPLLPGLEHDHALPLRQHDASERHRIMRYELTDGEWGVIKPMLPNRARGVPRVDDRCVPDNKRQHYVPKYMLRQFSCNENAIVDEDKRQINLLNIKRRKIVYGASLRDQCYRNYMYSKNLIIEHAINKLEGSHAELTKKIMSVRHLDLRDGLRITQLIALQKARTEQIESQFNDMANKLIKLMLFNKIPETLLRQARIKVDKATVLMLATALSVSPILLDLKQFLLINETSLPFIISDNPAVFTNWFFRRSFPDRPSEGMKRSGLQVYLPLSPNFALLLHDSNVYLTRNENGNIILRKNSDVKSLNSLQWLNAYNNIYFPPGIDEEYLREIMVIDRNLINQAFMKKFETRDNKIFHVTGKDEFNSPSEGVKSELIYISTTNLPRDIHIDAVRLRPKPRYVDNGSLGSLIRDPAWAQIIEDFSSAVFEKRVSFNDLWDFVENHSRSGEIGRWLGRNLRHAENRRQS